MLLAQQDKANNLLAVKVLLTANAFPKMCVSNPLHLALQQTSSWAAIIGGVRRGELLVDVEVVGVVCHEKVAYWF